MDASLVAVILVIYGTLYLLLSNAKGADGQKFGYRKMALMGIIALPFLASSVIEFTINYSDGTYEEVKITHSAWFLWFMPFAMLLSNLYHRIKRANHSAQHNAGSRPSSDDSPGSENPSAPAPRG